MFFFETCHKRTGLYSYLSTTVQFKLSTIHKTSAWIFSPPSLSYIFFPQYCVYDFYMFIWTLKVSRFKPLWDLHFPRPHLFRPISWGNTCWWFRNPVNSPVEVGSWNPHYLLRVFLPKHPNARWLALGFLNHQQYFQSYDARTSLCRLHQRPVHNWPSSARIIECRGDQHLVWFTQGWSCLGCL